MPGWSMCEPDVKTIFNQHPAPLEALAAGTIPALMIRRAFPDEACQSLVERLIEHELLYDPRRSVPQKFLDAAIPEGYYREGRGKDATEWTAKTAAGRRRIDIGTSLGYRGSDPEDFFAHSRETHQLFDRLFPDDLPLDQNPVRLLYATLQQLAPKKRVLTARESDGRQYGPAIIRAHYGGYTYAPHFDSVRLREKREGYVVHEFEHQFAGVLVLQNTQLGDRSAQCVLHRCLWEPDIDPVLRQGTFHEYAQEHKIDKTEVVLDPGDLYFFNTRCIHEVPGVAGELPRIVLATFIGYSSDRDEVMVWA